MGCTEVLIVWSATLIRPSGLMVARPPDREVNDRVTNLTAVLCVERVEGPSRVWLLFDLYKLVSKTESDTGTRFIVKKLPLGDFVFHAYCGIFLQSIIF